MQTGHLAILLLGSNLSDRRRHIVAAKKQIEIKVGSIEKESSIYETEPWGVTDQPNYLNAALTVRTKLAPPELLSVLKMIETKEGRTDRRKYASRTLDIDILFYDDLILNVKELTIPHPKLQLRKFVLIPLLEIAPRFVHPVFRQSVEELLEECKDNLEVNRLPSK